MDIYHLVTGAFQANTYFVPVKTQESNALVIVDPGGDEDSIVSYIKKSGLQPIAIVLTHGHFDHVGALPFLKKIYVNIKIGINSCDQQYLGKNGYELQHQSFSALGASELVSRVENKFLTLPDPDFFLEDNTIPYCMPGWQVIHTPGHTPGSVCLYNKDEAKLLSGDTLFAGSCGRTDLLGGNMQDMNTSLQKLLELPDSVSVYPGHGSLTSIGRERSVYGW